MSQRWILNDKILNVIFDSIDCPEKTQWFVNTSIRDFQIIKDIVDRRQYVSSITTKDKKDEYDFIHEELKREEKENLINEFICEDMDTYDCDILDKFQCCLVFPEFKYNKETSRMDWIESKDKYSIYQSSKNVDNTTFKHLMNIEQAFRAAICGGYIFTVVPDNWRTTDMIFNKWLMHNISKVYEFELPEDMIQVKTLELVDDEKIFEGNLFGFKSSFKYKVKQFKYIKQPILNKFKIICWFKFYTKSNSMNAIPIPNSENNVQDLLWAEMTYTPLEVKVNNEEQLDSAIERFKNNEWYKMNIFQWLKMSKSNSVLFSRRRYNPIGFDFLNKTTFVSTSSKAQQKLLEIKDDQDLSRSTNKIEIKLTRSKIILIGYNRTTISLIQRMIRSKGYIFHKEKSTNISKYTAVLKRNFEFVKQDLINSIFDFGMIPCIRETTKSNQDKKAKRLSKQLTPIERFEQVNSATRSPGKFSIGISDEWREVNSDIGVKETLKEDYELWCRRARKMKIDMYTFDFQFNDIVISCIKDSVINGSVMGLGKTRELLFTMILKGYKRNLIIVPTKLIGEWQDEIENTILPYMRIAKRHWSGELLKPQLPNIVEYASDCLPDKLKQFNIIGYDKLKSVPRDGKFYQCPVCNFVVYKFFETGKEVRCPGDPVFKTDDPRDDLSCTGNYRRYVESMKETDDNGKLIYRKYKIHIPTGRVVHWDKHHPSRKEYHERECEIVDTRKDNPNLDSFGRIPLPPIMRLQSNMFDKTVSVLSRFERSKDRDGNEILTPKIFKVKRKYHVKWTFAELLRNKFNSIGADEIRFVKNRNSKRSRATYHLNAKHKIPATGTPLRGYPQDTLGWINWALSSDLFPDYRHENPDGISIFMNRFKTDVIIGGPSTGTSAKKKQIPKIRNANLFMNELSPFMIRRTRNEPNVMTDIPPIPVYMYDKIIDMDDMHRKYYREWLDAFIEWWRKMKEEEEGKNVGNGNILAKLQYLVGASTSPHGMLARLKKKKNKDKQFWRNIIDDYKGPATGKMRETFKLIKEAQLKKDKIIVFTSRRDTIDLGHKICLKKGINSIIVDGRIPLTMAKNEKRSKRHLEVQRFREENITVLWAGLTALAEGMNIPEANRVVLHDTSWEHQDAEQGIGRVTRPQQKKPVYVYFLMHKGTVEEFKVALCYLKHRSHSEAIDGVSFDDFNSSMIPDFRQYADSIVDGTEEVVKREMWTMIDKLKADWETSMQKEMSKEEEEEEDQDLNGDSNDDE